ncbi:hypothetical protein [Pontiella agarivorans]|uniref:SLA1 homology domain-containing protein n=1 Tax=Pontiella agarivorans TaxID=3038953 RepID=A0ABU5MU62_9BACT|nr:hypothetical protein [Pontiella agarivorans]MDZ8117769.1 hypothetical protein [Pontiella agarivorans]
MKYKRTLLVLSAALFSGSVYAEVRMWTTSEGKTFEAEYVHRLGPTIVLKTAKGKQAKVPLSGLSEEDRAYIQLEQPPEFDIEFIRISEKVPEPPPTPFVDLVFPSRSFDWTFGVRVKQKDAKFDYGHQIFIEYYAMGKEVGGDHYVFLSKEKSSFTPTKENQGIYSFRADDPVRTQTKALTDQASLRGTEYEGYVVILRDERGEIIQYEASKKIFFAHIENIKKLHYPNRFNDEGVRVAASRPKEVIDRGNPWLFK